MYDRRQASTGYEYERRVLTSTRRAYPVRQEPVHKEGADRYEYTRYGITDGIVTTPKATLEEAVRGARAHNLINNHK